MRENLELEICRTESSLNKNYNFLAGQNGSRKYLEGIGEVTTQKERIVQYKESWRKEQSVLGHNSERTKREGGKYGKVRYGEKTGKIFIEILTGAAQR